MRVTKRQLQRIIREERQALIEREGYLAREDERLGAEYGAVGDEDFTGDHAEEEASRRDDAEFEERHRRAHDQGYDDREDERLGMEHGAEDEHTQSYHDRRDDARGVWGRRDESARRRRLKNQLYRIVGEHVRRRRHRR